MRRWWTLTAIVVVLASGCDAPATQPPSVTALASSSTSTSLAETSTSVPTTPTSTTTTTTTTTTVVAIPPTLEVTDPGDGAVVTATLYTFRGRTDPGCSVDVGGKYFADVDADGNWSIDLKLRPGGNATTFTATNASGLTSTSQIRLGSYPIVTIPDDPRLRPETLTGRSPDGAVPEEFRNQIGMCVAATCSYGVEIYFSDLEGRARYLVLYNKLLGNESDGPAIWEIVDAVYVEFSPDLGLEVRHICWTSPRANDIDVLVAPASHNSYKPLLAWKGEPGIEGFVRVVAETADCEAEGDW
jgi:hypothetical protein